ncbi:hypothetical protein GCM10025762_15770 [Haloechinothrix salitolerans]
MWLQRGAAGVVAAVAAYVSYDHQWAFALAHGARGIAAAVWPLSVDGLLVLASLALLDPALTVARPWVRVVVRVAFVAGVVVSLAANVAAAGRWDWAPVLVAGWPPLALLLSVEILIHSATRDTRTETQPLVTGEPGDSRVLDLGAGTGETVSPGTDTPAAVGAGRLDSVSGPDETALSGRRVRRGEAQRVMWEHYRCALAQGRTLTGAELDRIAGTRDYGRAVLARWRRTGRIPATSDTSENRSTVDESRAAEPITAGPVSTVATETTESNETPASGSGGGVTAVESYRDTQEANRDTGRAARPVESGRAAA